MELSAVKTWQWMAAALVVGLVVGVFRDYSRQTVHGNYIEGFGYFLGDQGRFENALVEEIDGQRRFRDITVYQRRVENGGEFESVYLVKGIYYSGPLLTVNGRNLGGWQPTCFVARVPYEPMTDFSTLQKPGAPDWGKKFRTAGVAPSVVDFLGVMRDAAGVKYRVAWWDAHPLVISTAVCAVVIGLVWPVLINVLTFHKLTRPAEAKAISLWKVRNRKRAISTSPTSGPTHDPHEPRMDLDEAPPSPEPERRTSPLDLEPGPPAAVSTPTADRTFGAKEDDYYPTERHPADGHEH